MATSDTAEPAAGDEQDAFAYIALEGAQFEEEGMPASAATEVVTYSQAVYQVARDLYLLQNGASRVPTAFTNAFDLRLVSIEPGSARPKLILRKPQSVRQQDFDEFAPLFEAARDSVTGALRTAAAGNPLPASFPQRAIAPLRRLGTTLDKTSQLVVGAPHSAADTRATVTTSTRAILRDITTLLEEPVEPTEVEALGVITEYDSVHWTFDLRREDDRKTILCRIVGNQETLAEAAKRALSINGIVGADVRVTGFANLDAEGDFSRIFDVESLDVERTVNEKAIMSKVQQMRDLQPGWWGTGSVPPTAELIETVEGLIDFLRDLEPQIAVAPTADGGVEFEWRMAGAEHTVVLAPGDSMAFYVDNLETDEVAEHEQPYDETVLRHFFETGTWS